ncbi:MAG: TrkA family potassium uptake protein [bacterium]
MKIVIAGGSIEVDYLIKMFRQSHHDLIVINEDRHFCEYLSEMNNIAVIAGDPSKTFVLEDANIMNADVIIALSPKDADNLVVCQLAKRAFHVKRAIAIVSNPKNVSIFMKLGINNAISSSHLIAQTIERLSIIETLVRSLSIEDEKIVITELIIGDEASVTGKQVKDIDSSVRFNLSCIFRDPEVIIPKGDTVIRGGDKLIVVSSAIDQSQIVELLQRKRNDG